LAAVLRTALRSVVSAGGGAAGSAIRGGGATPAVPVNGKSISGRRAIDNRAGATGIGSGSL